jgi:hypothetical protein
VAVRPNLSRGRARHRPRQRANEPLRLLIQLIPGGTEELYAEVGAYLQNVVGAPDEELTAAIMARYGGTRVGPRIAVAREGRSSTGGPRS